MNKYFLLPEWDRSVIKLFLLIFLAFIHSFIENKFDFNWLRRDDALVIVLYGLLFYYMYLFYGDYLKLFQWIKDEVKNLWLQNSLIKNLGSVSLVIFIVLSFINFWGPSNAEIQTGLDCSNKYSELNDTVRERRGYSIAASRDEDSRMLYFGYLIKEYQIAIEILELGCEDLNSNVRVRNLGLELPPLGDLSGTDMLVKEKICFLGYEYQWFESFLNNREVREWPNDADCSKGREILNLD